LVKAKKNHPEISRWSFGFWRVATTGDTNTSDATGFK